LDEEICPKCIHSSFTISSKGPVHELGLIHGEVIKTKTKKKQRKNETKNENENEKENENENNKYLFSIVTHTDTCKNPTTTQKMK
jgi:hypothetical protein